MVRRGFASALILSLVGLTPTPAATCCLASGLEGHSQCPMTQCAGMANAASSTTGTQISCQCTKASAPLPEAVETAACPARPVLAAKLTLPELPLALTSLSNLQRIPPSPSPGPPGGQARLCVYLI